MWRVVLDVLLNKSYFTINTLVVSFVHASSDTTKNMAEENETPSTWPRKRDHFRATGEALGVGDRLRPDGAGGILPRRRMRPNVTGRGTAGCTELRRIRPSATRPTATPSPKRRSTRSSSRPPTSRPQSTASRAPTWLTNLPINKPAQINSH